MNTPAPAGTTSPADTPAIRPALIDSRALFGSAHLVVIHHAGTDYRLRITSQNKLILTI